MDANLFKRKNTNTESESRQEQGLYQELLIVLNRKNLVVVLRDTSSKSKTRLSL